MTLKESTHWLMRHYQINNGDELYREISEVARCTHNAAIDAAAQFTFGYTKEKVLELKR